jgi:glycosyltransferase involved in cell wall biosynthesis
MLPLVSVITPTRARPDFLALTARWLEHQSYAGPIEWLIVNADTKPLERLPRFDRAVRRFERVKVLDRTGATGFLRNEACRLASGSIIVQVDDDDYQFPARLALQVEALSQPGVEFVCSDDFYVALFDESHARGQRSVSWGDDRFMCGCTFAYRRSAWVRAPFRNIQIGEDYLFARQLRTLARAGCVNMRDPGLMVYVRHAGNTCAFDETMRAAASAADADWIRSLVGESAWHAIERAATTTKPYDFVATDG